MSTAEAGNVRIGAEDFVVIAGPCVIESEELCLEVAQELLRLQTKWAQSIFFKPPTIKLIDIGRVFQGPRTGKRVLRYLHL